MKNQDFERESEKELVYLLEKKIEEEREYWEWENRKPAEIVIINRDKIKKDEPVNNILPF